MAAGEQRPGRQVITIGRADQAICLSIASLALEFCRQPETWPVFAAWAAGHPGGPPPLTRAVVEVADRVITEWAAQKHGIGDGHGG